MVEKAQAVSDYGWTRERGHQVDIGQTYHRIGGAQCLGARFVQRIGPAGDQVEQCRTEGQCVDDVTDQDADSLAFGQPIGGPTHAIAFRRPMSCVG